MQGARGLLRGEGDHEVYYMEKEIMEEQLTFGAVQNDSWPELKEPKRIKPTVEKKGSKEIRLSELTRDRCCSSWDQKALKTRNGRHGIASRQWRL